MRLQSHRKPTHFHFPFRVLLFIAILFITPQGGSAAPSGDTRVMDAAAKELLEDIKIGTATANAKLNTGTIKFTLTLTERTHFALREPDEVKYEAQGHWDITYHFDGEQQFYDVKVRKKRELNGAPLPNWQQTHHQYWVDREMLHVWEKIGTEWKAHLPQKMSSSLLEPQYSPHWWSWPPWGFKLPKLFHMFKPIEVKPINSDGIRHYHLTLQRTDPDSTRTCECWLDPQKDYRPTQILSYRQSVYPFKESTDLTRYTYQIAQFDPDIWFPQTTTMEILHLGKNRQSLPPIRKITMHVTRAGFNDPIAEEDLHIHRDK